MRIDGPLEQSVEKIDLAQNEIFKCDGRACLGKISVVGIGPGNPEDMTPRALAALRDADTVVGYNTYIELIRTFVADKEIIGTAMMQEVARCQLAVDHAANGEKVVVVSSGDAGIYGMAGLVLELLMKLEDGKRPEVRIIAGVSAVSAAAAILGAPLMHDFAVLSLSDLMTPWELIKKRASLAAQGDFVIALYNPKSKKRVRHIEEIQSIVLQYKSPDTPVGIVRQAGREEESAVISTLADFTKEPIDMFSLVIIGNKSTYVKGQKMITPRGYQL